MSKLRSEVTFDVSIPYDRPGNSGRMHTREAIKNAISKSSVDNLPIVHEDGTVAGHIYSCDIGDDIENSAYRIKFKGIVYQPDMEYIIRDSDEFGIVTDFSFRGFSI